MRTAPFYLLYLLATTFFVAECQGLCSERGTKLTVSRDLGVALELYLQGGKGKIVGTPDWTIIVLPGRTAGIYSKWSKKYSIIDLKLNKNWYQAKPLPIKWHSWKKIGTGKLLNRIDVQKWERAGQLQSESSGVQLRQEVWTTNSFPISEDFKLAFCKLCDIDSPNGLPVRCLQTTVKSDGARETKMLINVVRCEPASLAESDLSLPKGLKKVSHAWDVVSTEDVNECLYLKKVRARP